jgi:hypothetical protein
MDEIVDSTVVIFVVMRENEKINCAHTIAIHDGLDSPSHAILATIHQHGLPSWCNKQGSARLLDIDVVDTQLLGRERKGAKKKNKSKPQGSFHTDSDTG